MVTEDTTTQTTPTLEDVITQEPRRRSRWIKHASIAVVGAIVVGVTTVLVTLVIASQDLPELRSLGDYKPPQATVVFGAHGEVVARFAEERRTIVPYAKVPRVMIDAVLASEDDLFFQHEGLDYVGMARCFVMNLVSGRTRCGGSTITQQMVKTFLLSSERTYTRKLKEIILAKRVEDALSKDDILYLYLNQIYFGHGAYGVQEAARVYFGKDVFELEVEEAALLAGVVQSPSRLDPYRHPERAIKRRSYVLGRMRELKKIDEATYEAKIDAPLNLDWGSGEEHLDNNNHYASEVRRMLEELVGEDRLKLGGLRVYTGLEPKQQEIAQVALEAGLRALDKRQGWRGPILHLERDQEKQLARLIAERIEKVAPSRAVSTSTATSTPVIADLSRFQELSTVPPIDELAAYLRFPRFKQNHIYGGRVTEVDNTTKKAVVDLGGAVQVELSLRSGLSWARPFSLGATKAAPKTVSDVLKEGDVVLVRATEAKKAPGRYAGILEQAPKAQAALIALDPFSREVRAMVGGYGLGAGRFNRATQARRQAGSTFKPLVYAAAFETGNYSPISECIDQPYVEYDPWMQRAWKPENYGGTFDGRIDFRTALTRSKNLCSVRLIKAIGVEHVIELAKRVGIESTLPQSLTLSLGSGDVTPMEMVNAYATIASGGITQASVIIRKIVDADGALLLEAKEARRQALKPEVAFQVTSMMESVVQDGTAQAVKALGRPVAGKTGTTNDARDAWFIGFVPNLVAGVWVGFDDSKTLGPLETGGRAAIPIWLDFMKGVLEGEPVKEFIPPAGIVFAVVDPETGLLASPDNPRARVEPFVTGTAPTEYGGQEESRPDAFGLEDME